jgi:AraC-like DNA-binding protein
MSSFKKYHPNYIQPKWLLDFFANQQVDTNQLSAIAGIAPESLISEQGFVNFDVYLILFEWAAENFKIPLLGQQLATKSVSDDFGTLGFLYYSASTLGEFCSLLIQYQRILMTGAEFDLVDQGELIEVRYSVDSDHIKSIAQDVEYSLGVLVNCIRGGLGNDWLPTNVTFSHPALESEDKYKQLFGNNVAFNQNKNSILFERVLLNNKIRTANPNLLEVLKDQARRLLRDIDTNRDFLDSVKFLLRSQISNEEFYMETLAAQLNMTSRTLHRKLKQKGETYNGLRIGLVVDMAKDALLKSDASIAELAQDLGYSDSSAFVRIFKRHLGVSPLQFRKLRSI